MSSSTNTLITVNLVIVLLCLGATLTSLILRVVYGDTGIKLSYFYPSCNKPYFNIKFGYTYLSLLVQFIALGVATLFSIIAAIFLILPLVKSSSTTTAGAAQVSSEKQQQTPRYQVLYVACSLCLLGSIVAGGGALNYIFQGGNCMNISQYIKTIVNYCSLGALGLAFLSQILILVLLCQRSPLPETINMDELKRNAENRSDEQDLNRQLQDEAKDYLQYMSKQRQQAQQGLLGYQQSIYSPHYNQDTTELDQNLFKKPSNSEQGSEYTYQYQQVVVDEAGIQQKQNLGANSPIGRSLEGNSPSLKPSQPQSPLKSLNSEAVNSRKQNGLMLQKASSHVVEDDNNQIEQQLQGFQLQEDDNKHYRELPEEVRKVLLTTLFRTTLGNTAPEPNEQRECPILRYLERDQRQQVTQNDFKLKGTSKKKLYERQKLYFQKKRKQVRPEEDFDEEEQIRKDRLQRFGEEWVKKREQEEEAIRKEISDRFKKRQGLETIRSKYYH